MRVLHVAIATADVLVVARFAPFGRAPRALFAFGYFVVYEYAAISRCYGLALLFALLLCVNHPRRFARPIVTGLLLAALALTTTVATLVAAAYAAALVVDWIAGARRRDQYTRRGWIPVALAVSGGLAAALCAWPPADSTVAHVGHPPRDLPWDFAPTRLVAALVPIPRADFFFWNSNALLEWSPLEHVRFALALALFAWIVFALSRDRFATILFGAGVVLLVALFAGVYPGDARHHGFLFVLFLMAAWIAWSTKGRTLAPTLALVLFVHVPAAAIAIAYDARYVFSSGRRAAEALRARGLQDALLVAEVDYAATAVLGQLGPHAQAYSPRTGRAFSFVRWTRDRLWDPTEEQTLRFAATLGSAHAADAVLVMNRPLLPELIDGARVTRLAEEYDSMIEEENFYIYRVKRDP
jgi:hypothetical protein